MLSHSASFIYMSPESDSSLRSGFSTRRRWLAGLAAGGAGVAAGHLFSAEAATAARSPWNVISIGDREYVSSDDVKKYYTFDRTVREGRAIIFESRAVRMSWHVATDDIFINKIKFCLCYPTVEQSGKVYVSRMDLAKLLNPILRPSHINASSTFNTIVIDPGHGGGDSGATGPYGEEKHYALDTAFRLKKMVEAAGFKTVLTRSSDVFIDRPERVRIANSIPGCVFVSIHYNSFNRSSIGLETFALAPQGTATTDKDLQMSDLKSRNGNLRDSENIALATAVHAMAIYTMGSVDRGVKRARYDVLAGIQRPAILVEGGFVSNPTEGARIHRPEFREALAKAITAGVRNFHTAIDRSSVPRRPRR